jgi:hypothetical protein
LSIGEILIVGEYREVFRDDIVMLEFGIDLLPWVGLVSKAPYRKSPIELGEDKRQIEDLLGGNLLVLVCHLGELQFFYLRRKAKVLRCV